MIDDAGIDVRTAVRKRESLYAELNLADADDDELLDAMAEHPILIERPFVVTPKGTRLARPIDVGSRDSVTGRRIAAVPPRWWPSPQRAAAHRTPTTSRSGRRRRRRATPTATEAPVPIARTWRARASSDNPSRPTN